MENKVVLITGASGDIGSCIAESFLNNNYKVVICYNNSKQSALNLAKKNKEKEQNYLCIKVDVSKYDDVKKLVNEVISIFGHIDILINCAGISSYNLLIDESDENIDKVINTNLIGTINMCKEVSKNMIKRNYGKIINISSVWGIFGASNETVYSASKGGINTFTKALAKELAYCNINVNAVAPGVVNTKMMSKFSEKELDEIKNEIPFGRFAEPKDISNLVLFLASDASNYITGQIIQIDGGFCV